MVVGSYALLRIDQTEQYGKEHDIKLNGLDSARWATGCVVLLGCAAVISLIPMTTVYYLYATGFWKEKVNVYLYTVSD